MVKEFTISKGNTYLTPLTDYLIPPSKGGPFSSEKSRYIRLYIYIYTSSLCDLVTEVQGRQTLFPKFSVTPVIMLSQFSSAERDIISQRGKLSRENSIIRASRQPIGVEARSLYRRRNASFSSEGKKKKKGKKTGLSQVQLVSRTTFFWPRPVRSTYERIEPSIHRTVIW